MEFTPLWGDLSFWCVPNISKCGPSWKVSCGIYIDCQNLIKSYHQCRGAISLSQEVFENECTETRSDKKEPILSFPLSQDLATYSKPQRSVLSIYWYPLSLQTPRVRTSHRGSFLNFGMLPWHLASHFLKTNRRVVLKTFQELTSSAMSPRTLSVFFIINCQEETILHWIPYRFGQVRGTFRHCWDDGPKNSV